MSQELHYTSVARGLKPGTRGFCTVACTSSLAPALAERLESLSGYRQVFPPQHPEVDRNPVAWSHLRWEGAGQQVSILSRVGYAGLDYTDRANKYAHHVALNPSERPAGGPAWLLRQPGFLQESWSGEPRVLPAGRTAPKGDVGPAVCHAWHAQVGDAGWAGVLAESFLAGPKRPAYLIFDPGTDPLPLFQEALALLPASRRWEVSFNTYFTGLPIGLECAWRGVLRDSVEAKQARSFPEALVLDLGKPLGEARGGGLVEQARTGERPAEVFPEPGSAGSAQPALGHAQAGAGEKARPPRRTGAEPLPPPPPQGDYLLMPPVATGPTAVRPAGKVRRARAGWSAGWVAGLAALAFLAGVSVGGGGVAFVLMGRSEADKVVRSEEHATAQTSQKAEPVATENTRRPHENQQVVLAEKTSKPAEPTKQTPKLDVPAEQTPKSNEPEKFDKTVVTKNEPVPTSKSSAKATPTPSDTPDTPKAKKPDAGTVGQSDSKKQGGESEQADAVAAKGGASENVKSLKFPEKPGQLGSFKLPDFPAVADEKSNGSNFEFDHEIQGIEVVGYSDKCIDGPGFEIEKRNSPTRVVVKIKRQSINDDATSLCTFTLANKHKVIFGWSPIGAATTEEKRSRIALAAQDLLDCALEVTDNYGRTETWYLRSIGELPKLPSLSSVKQPEAFARKAAYMDYYLDLDMAWAQGCKRPLRLTGLNFRPAGRPVMVSTPDTKDVDPADTKSLIAGGKFVVTLGQLSIKYTVSYELKERHFVMRSSPSAGALQRNILGLKAEKEVRPVLANGAEEKDVMQAWKEKNMRLSNNIELLSQHIDLINQIELSSYDWIVSVDIGGKPRVFARLSSDPAPGQQ